MNVQHRGYYAVVPANVRYDEDLSPNAKLLYGEITALSNERGYCWAGNNYFSELYKKDKSTIARWIKQLEDKGYIVRQVVYKPNSKEVEARYMQICEGGTRKNATTPIRKNAIDNTTELNTTEEEKDASLFYSENFGMPTPHMIENIGYWINDLSNEVVVQAMREALDRNVRNWKYVESILKDWVSKNVKTIQDIEGLKKEKEPKQKASEKSKEQKVNINEELDQAFM